MRIKVTKAEYARMMQNTFTRSAGGLYGGAHYNLLREAAMADPLATRCLSPLEDLARFKGITLQPGSAESVLWEFVRNPVVNVVSIEHEQIQSKALMEGAPK